MSSCSFHLGGNFGTIESYMFTPNGKLDLRKSCKEITIKPDVLFEKKKNSIRSQRYSIQCQANSGCEVKLVGI